MKIAHLTPGSGDNFYCENCLRDAELVKALRGLGHDVTMIPMYLPLQADLEEKVSNAPIFFGGINVYLQQKSRLFQKTPRWLDRLLDSPKLLSWLSRRAGMVDAQELGETTLSMLRGEQGRQKKELERLAAWLAEPENRPDLICLSNVLLAGMVGRLKELVGVPVACLLQDEDEFLDALIPEYKEKVWQLLSERAAGIDLFLSVSQSFAKTMQQRLHVPDSSIEVVYTGIPTERYEPAVSTPEKPTIGYLSRMCEGKGLETLVDAFIQLRRENKMDVQLKIAGGSTAEDKPLLDRVHTKLQRAELSEKVEWVGGLERTKRLDFLRSVSIVCVPEKRPPAYGLYVLEALAVGVPVVEPAIGVFHELYEQLGEAVHLYEGGADALAAELAGWLGQPQRLQELGRQGREAVLAKFDIRETARQVAGIFERTADNQNG